MSELLQFVQFKDLTVWSVLHLLNNKFDYNQKYKLVKITNFLTRDKTQVNIKDKTKYKRVKIKQYNQGLFLRDVEVGEGIGTKKQYLIKERQFLLSKIDARNGAFGVVHKEIDKAIITGNFWTYNVDYKKINPFFLSLITTTKQFMRFCDMASSGTTNRHYLQEGRFLNMKIPLPPLETQKTIVKNYQNKLNLAKQQYQQAQQKEAEIETYLYKELGIELPKEEIPNKNILQFVNFKNLQEWSFDFATKKQSNVKSIYSMLRVLDICNIGSGGTPSRDNLEYYKGNIPWVKTTEVKNNHIKDTSEKITEKAIKDKNLKLYPKGSLIMAMYGQGLTRGRISKLNIEATTNQACAVFYHFSKNINVDYLWFYLQNEYDRLRALASGNNQPNLNAQKIKNYPIIMPPLEIQNKIATHIQSLKNDIKDLKQQAEQNQQLALSEFEAEIFNVP